MAKGKVNLSVSQTELWYIIESLDLYEDYMVSSYLSPLSEFKLSSIRLADLKGRLLEQRKFRCRVFAFIKKHFGFGIDGLI